MGADRLTKYELQKKTKPIIDEMKDNYFQYLEY